jgi:hypothetical protein
MVGQISIFWYSWLSRYGFLSTQKLYFSRYICVTILGSWLTPVGIYCVWYIYATFLMRIFILEVTVQQYRTSINDYLVNIDTIISSTQENWSTAPIDYWFFDTLHINLLLEHIKLQAVASKPVLSINCNFSKYV